MEPQGPHRSFSVLVGTTLHKEKNFSHTGNSLLEDQLHSVLPPGTAQALGRPWPLRAQADSCALSLTGLNPVLKGNSIL